MKSSAETFKKIGIPLRTGQLYVQLGLFPRPSMEGRKGFYDWEKTQIIEKGAIIKLLKDEFKRPLEEILQLFRRNEGRDLKAFLNQLERFIVEFPAESEEPFNGRQMKFCLDRNAVARRWFFEMVKNEGVMDEESYLTQVKFFNNKDGKGMKEAQIKAAMEYYCLNFRK